MNRVDLYTPIHKGLRALLFDTARRASGTDFSRPAERAALLTEVRRLLAFLEEHADHEDEHILPALAPLAPELHESLRAEHTRTAGLESEVARLLERLERGAAEEHEALGRRLADRLLGLLAEHVAHHLREEGEVNRVLWARLEDAELLAIQDRIVASIEPARLADWYLLFLPAVSGAERREMLLGLRAAVPPEVFEELTAPARRALGEELWREALGA